MNTSIDVWLLLETYSALDSQVNNCRTSHQTKELAQLLTRAVGILSAQNNEGVLAACQGVAVLKEGRTDAVGSVSSSTAQILCKSISSPTAEVSHGACRKGDVGCPSSSEEK